MSLIYCKACGKQISANAPSCPSCGEPQKQKRKSSPTLLIFLLLAIAAFAVYWFWPKDSNIKSTTESYESKTALAKEVLGSKCDGLANIASEYIKSDFVASLVAAGVNNRCDCMLDVVAPKLADRYSYKEIESMRNKPIQSVIEIKNIVSQHSGEILSHCLSFKKK